MYLYIYILCRDREDMSHTDRIIERKGEKEIGRERGRDEETTRQKDKTEQ